MADGSPFLRSHRFRAYPTAGQEGRAIRMLRDFCDLYNAALEERREARARGVSVNYYSQCAQLKDIRADNERLAGWSSQSEQRVLRRLDRSFQGFFRRVKAGQTPGYPRFKSWKRFDTAVFTAGNGSMWVPAEGRWSRAYFKGVGHVKVNAHRPVTGKVKTLSLKREGKRWFVIVVEEFEPERLEPTGSVVGVDVGVARFATLSNGDTIDNPRFARDAATELAGLQAELAGAKKGSSRARVLRRRIARLHRKTRNRRLDFHHKTTRALVDAHDLIVVEDLNVAGMVRRARPRPDPENLGGYLPNGGSRKTGLNRSISDVGWAQFARILEGKAEWAGRQVIRVNPAYTSIRCHQCGATCERPRQDTVTCPEHGGMDADLNGAINILRAGLGSTNTPMLETAS